MDIPSSLWFLLWGYWCWVQFQNTDAMNKNIISILIFLLSVNSFSQNNWELKEQILWKQKDKKTITTYRRNNLSNSSTTNNKNKKQTLLYP